MVVVSYCRGRPRLVLVNRLEGLSLPRNSATINWPARHDLVVDWAVKLQHKQNKKTNIIKLYFLIFTMNLCVDSSFEIGVVSILYELITPWDVRLLGWDFDF